MISGLRCVVQRGCSIRSRVCGWVCWGFRPGLFVETRLPVEGSQRQLVEEVGLRTFGSSFALQTTHIYFSGPKSFHSTVFLFSPREMQKAHGPEVRKR